jgi:structural maintenance of chromosome 1
MDAISFVLGVQSKDLRSQQMKDLIFRPPGGSSGNLSASATLVFQKTRKGEDEDETDSEEKDEESTTSGGDDDASSREIRFSRRINTRGVGSYHVNNVVVSHAEYEQALADIGVLVKARNFLVFQGDVEALARKSPLELVALVEQISGSAALQSEYDQAWALQQETAQATVFAWKKQKALRAERKLLNEQKQEAEKFHALVEEKAELKTQMYLRQLYHLDQDRIEHQERLEELQSELQEHEATEKELTQALAAVKKQASAARRQTGQLEQTRVQLASQVDRIEPSVIQNQEELKNLLKKVAQDEKALVKKQQEAEKHAVKLQAIDAEIEEYKQTLQVLEQDYNARQEEQAGIRLTAAQEEEYERVRLAATAASAEPRQQLQQVLRQLDKSQNELDTLSVTIKEAQDQRQEHEGYVREFSERQEKLEKVRSIRCVGVGRITT